MKSIILDVSNVKGGTAKTTTSLNLATELSKENYRVLLIDLDPQGSLSKAMLGEHDLANYHGIEELLGDAKLDVEEYITPTKISNVSIIPCHATLSEVAVKLLMNASFFALKDVLRRVMELPYSSHPLYSSQALAREMLEVRMLNKITDSYQNHCNNFDFIIIDTQPAKNILMLNAFAASDYVLIPTNPSVYPLMDIVELEETILSSTSTVNPNLSILGVLITMVQRATVYKQLERDLRDYFGDKVFTTTISRAAKSEESALEGVGVSELDPRCKLAEEYHLFTIELLNRLGIVHEDDDKDDNNSINEDGDSIKNDVAEDVDSDNSIVDEPQVSEVEKIDQPTDLRRLV